MIVSNLTISYNTPGDRNINAFDNNFIIKVL
jgi:hypothetical protein